MATAKATTDHDTIRSWVEERGGCPAQVKRTGTRGNPGIIRIDYTGFSGKNTLQKIPWKKFFDAFEANGLAFLYAPDDASRFSKLVSRDSVEVENKRNGAKAKNGKGSNGKIRGDRSKNGKLKEHAPNSVKLLTDQHRQVSELFDQLDDASSIAEKRRLFMKVADMLAAHTKIEETIFYPAVFTEQTEEELRESVEEHLVAKRLIADLLKLKPSEPQFMSKLSVLREVVEHHVEEEEAQLFPAVREADLDDLAVLGQQMQKRFKELMKSKPHENVPRETRAAAPLG